MALTFDTTFYLQNNPDVLAAVLRGETTAEQHYNTFGWQEQRDPSAFFDTSFYLLTYTDVLNARVNPFQHFLQFGAAEDRLPNANIDGVIDTDGDNFADEFDGAAYLAANPDVAAAGYTADNAYLHFVVFGQFESRSGTQLTDGTAITGPFTSAGSGGGLPVNTIALTTAVDNLTGTSGSDVFNGVAAAANSTLNDGDAINGGGGSDTLNILVTSGGSAAVVDLTSVETVSIRDASGVNFDASGWTGVTTIQNDRSTSTASVSNVQNNVALSILNSDEDLSVDFAAGALGADATLNLSANGALSSSDFSVTTNGSDSIATVNLNVVTKSVTSLDVGTSVETLNISGAGSLELENFDVTSVVTVDASKNSGGVTLDLDGAADLTTVTGSSGNDDISLAGTDKITVNGGAGNDRFYFGTSLTKDDVVNGGEGNDIVAVDGTDFSASADVAGLNAVTNVETIEFVNNAGTTTITGATFKNTAVTELLFNTAGNDIVNNAGARLYSFGSDNGGNATFNSTLGQTTLNLALKGDATATGDEAVVGTIVANGATTINIASTGATTDNNVISALTVATNSSIVITGDQDLDINGVSAASSINGSAATGDLKITGSTGSDVIVGGAGDDVLFGGNAAAGGAATREVFQATFAGDEAGGDTTIAFDGVTVTLTGAPANAAAIASAFTAAYNSDAARSYNAVNDGAGQVTFTSIATGARTDVTAGSFVVTANTADDATVSVGGVTVTQQGSAAGSATLFADTLTGGAGKDVFQFITGATTAQISTITDLDLGTGAVGGQVDTLSFNLATAGAATIVTLTAAEQTAITGAANIGAAVNLALTAADGTNEVVQFTYGSDTYIAVNGANAGFAAADDVVVRVTGLSGTLDASDIVIS